MKKLLSIAAFAAIFALLLTSCSNGNDDDDADKIVAVPSITMEGADIDAEHIITPTMSVKVNMEVPGKIKALAIKIQSTILTDAFLQSVNLAAEMDLANPANDDMAAALKDLGFKVGAEVVGEKSISFDISQLVPLIAQLCNANPNPQPSSHNFVLTVADNKSQSVTKTLKFKYTPTPVVEYANDANLWTNSATLTAASIPSGSKVQYRVKGTDQWIETQAKSESSFAIEPVWVSSTNAADIETFSVLANTGIFAATTYECRVVDGEQVVASSEFTTANGDVIPNSDMSGWSKKDVIMGDNTYKITYPNMAGESIWDSANNPFLENPKALPFTPLCEQAYDLVDNADGTVDTLFLGSASLSARMVMGFVFAAGNMFTGDFNYTGMTGTVKFGKKYAWSARPRGMKLRYKATVGTIDKVGSYDPDGDNYEGQQDLSRVFVAIVDWTAQHGVTSGMGEPKGMWDPTKATSLDEGNILAYGDLPIAETVGEWTEVTLPINWYTQAAAMPSQDNFSLVISCATSSRGDYLTGCSTNQMLVDDFEWVY